MSSWLYRPKCTNRLQRIFRDIEFKKKRTFPEPSIIALQDALAPKIGGYQSELKREIEVMMNCVNNDYANKEKELENIDESEIENFVDGYEYRLKQVTEMMGFLMNVLETACNNEKEMLEKLEKDEKLIDIVNGLNEHEKEEIKLKEREEMMIQNYKKQKAMDELTTPIGEEEE